MKRIPMPTLQILKHDITHGWSEEDHAYIVESRILPNVFIGVGESFEEAYKDFCEAAVSVYDEVFKNNIAGYDFIRSDKTS